jgi:hypothetical protein
MSPFPVLLLLIAQSPAPFEGTAVDAEGRPVSGLEILLLRGQLRNGSVPILARSSTDAQGRFRLNLPPAGERAPSWFVPSLFAYRRDWDWLPPRS